MKMWRDLTNEERQEEKWKRKGRPSLFWDSKMFGPCTKDKVKALAFYQQEVRKQMEEGKNGK